MFDKLPKEFFFMLRAFAFWFVAFSRTLVSRSRNSLIVFVKCPQ